MTSEIVIESLDAGSFARFGDVLEVKGQPTEIINRGKCERFTDLAALEFTQDGRAGISLFQAQPYQLPLQLDYVERHPLGSQAFLPMTSDPFLVVVADDRENQPVNVQAFVTHPGQGVNYHRGIWHGVLTPLNRSALFAVVDRLGTGENLEEYWFEEPYIIKYADSR